MVLPLVAPIAGAVWVGKAIFGGDDMSLVNEMLPIYLAVQEGSPRPLHEASTLASSHSKGQEKFASDADKLATLLSEAWEGDAAEGATKKVKKLAKAARETGTSLNTNAQNFDSQASSFGDLRGKMKHMDNPAPGGSGFLDRVNPLDTGAEKAVRRNQEAAEHNKALYDQYSSTTKSNAESITDKYGHAGSPGSGTQPQQPPYPGYPGDPGKRPPGVGGDDKRKAEEAARKAQEEARRKAEEQRRKMEEEARKRQEEAQRKAEEQRRKMEEEARKRQEEAQRRAEEQRRKMEEEARKRQEEAQRRAEEQRRRMEEEARRRQQEAAQRAREAAEAMRRGSGSFTPGGTSASSFSPSDFAGAGSGGGLGASGAGGAGAGGFGASGDAAAAGAGRASGAMAPGGGTGAGGAGAGRGGGGGRMGGMGGMMGGAGGGGGKGGEDKEHKRKVMATENPNDLFGTDEKSVPPVIGDK